MTKSFNTTTTLYYTLFLPGVFLYEFSLWLAAGVLDVRADRAITWPEAQEIGELRLNFVQIEPKISPVKKALIYATPLLTGLIAVWLIATRVLNATQFLETIQTGYAADISRAVSTLTATTDFWLWLYIAFTISNTMIPDFKALAALRNIIIVLAIAASALFLLGAGDETVVRLLDGPIRTALDLLSSTFVIIIGLDIFAVLVLAIVENTIEYITGDSASFSKGKMIAIRRSEKRALRQQERARRTRRRPASTGPPSIYRLPLPIPGAPGDEPVSQGGTIVDAGDKATLPAGPPPGTRARPSVIEGAAEAKPDVSAARSSAPRLPAPTPQPDEKSEEQSPKIDQSNPDEATQPLTTTRPSGATEKSTLPAAPNVPTRRNPTQSDPASPKER